ncbi:cytochrome P450 [Micromonospora sp. CPCC 206061]|uniref:cytochrome P450 n=1 Tax=Micromonospora sp. CPCC 206061 TaxID=3122410 RepID=UPI002FF43130
MDHFSGISQENLLDSLQNNPKVSEEHGKLVDVTAHTTVKASAPGPAGHPMLGMAPAFRRDMLGTLLAGFRDYGDTVSYRFGPRWGPHPLSQHVVMAHHPEAVHEVLTTGRVFSRRTTGFQVLTEFIGTGLLTSDGDVWLRQRRTLQPLFTPRRVAGYTELMTAEAARIAAEPAAAAGSTVDLHHLMQRYALRVVGRALFGDDVDEAVPELQRLMPVLGDLALARALQMVRTPLRWPTPRARRITRERAAQYAIVDRIIAKHASRGTGEDRDDMLSRLHAARDPETGQPLSAEEIRDQVLVFLLAGHETTAGALTFTLYLLGRYPAAQERVAASGPSGDADLVRAALMEGMRLYPPAYSTERLADVDTTISGHHVPAGTRVMLSSYVTHRHPEFWPDPDRFDPNRFTGQHDRPRYAYFPFGGGPRSCIGEHFALLEATVLLRTLLARYRVEALDGRLPLAPMITLRPAEPVRAILRPR